MIDRSMPDQLAAMQRLIETIAKLRSPDGGCPWDLAQTPQSLMPYIIEEAYETVDALRRENPEEICEELGDLLLQVVLQAQISSEMGQFSLTEIADGINEKLIRRHPHVFGETNVESMEEVQQNWQAIKAAEKGEAPTLLTKLERYRTTLPPLISSMKISKKAAASGFEWDDINGVWDKFNEELGEFKHAIAEETQAEQQAELGDLLFTLVNLARWLDLDPSEALQETNQKFLTRLKAVDELGDRPLSEYSLEELETLWQQAKEQLRSSD
ncbi:nucleoside triphosphate pyrophosphohydrolase [Roseofilum casamattae]|uniref:Nucleoside triphosphate pyrophosphohydrolase n=1 Tax=Roseofilum casamattae BLCC-M143 TaxID=3022442 RepID=A0ABT7BR43_9CYAN|nr:nucleoside triphosphate pyrophosphohydrolase [Roseofilum casamattae]MDJ1181646.1 nucleoside triphosphate pyrophosphohydrolase [Roseofilum casamattae BLCC-M143]